MEPEGEGGGEDAMVSPAGSARVGAFAGDGTSRSVRPGRCQALRHVLAHEMLVRRGHGLPPSKDRRNCDHVQTTIEEA
jgi:hypothetical protein